MPPWAGSRTTYSTSRRSHRAIASEVNLLTDTTVGAARTGNATVVGGGACEPGDSSGSLPSMGIALSGGVSRLRLTSPNARDRPRKWLRPAAERCHDDGP